MTIIFWVSLFLIFYTFFGYGILLFILVKIRGIIFGIRKIPGNEGNWPTVTVIIAAYNEEDYITDKIDNTLALDYPADKIQYLFVTDGSTDRTPELAARYPRIKLMHHPERGGKVAAMDRAMKEVNTEVVIFTDANTSLNKTSLLNICRHYRDPKVGAVSGEKRVKIEEMSDATAGEGFYWKYESKLKTWDSELYTVVGAAGELFSVRTKLFEPVPADTILDDFMITMLIAQKGYRIIYEKEAYAQESGSENVQEELKRKIRIAAGGIQSILRLKPSLNPFRHFTLAFQFISHRVLRWTITPFLMMLAFILNIFLALQGYGSIYTALLMLQLLFYVSSLLGWVMERRQVRIKTLFIPYYFCMMNYAVAAGIRRYFLKKQSAAWEKSKRKS
jgi:biofilm PGA synthesis N-glycosyltransferase PgaC